MNGVGNKFILGNGVKLMKVGLVVPYLSGHGGMETVFESFVEHYDKSKMVSLSVCFPQGVENTEFLTDNQKKKFKVKKLANKKHIRQTLGILNLTKYLLTTDASIIICMSSTLVKAVSKLRAVFHKKFLIVSWLHFSIADEAALNYDDLRLADYHFAISSGIKKQLVTNQISENKVFTIYNPVSISKHRIVRRSDDGITRFVYIGRMMWGRQKNLQELLMTFKKINGNCELYLIGTGTREDIVKIKSYIEDEHMDNVVQVGWQRDPWFSVPTIDCTVLTSKFEGFPMVLVESIAQGVPVISSDCPTGPEDIVTQKNGILYPVGSGEKLKHALQGIVDGKYDFSQSNVLHSSQKFSSDVYYKNVSKALSEMEYSSSVQ